MIDEEDDMSQEKGPGGGNLVLLGEEAHTKEKEVPHPGTLHQTGDENHDPDSLPGYVVLKDSTAQIKKEISRALPGLNFDAMHGAIPNATGLC
jgi:hypothetical protein